MSNRDPDENGWQTSARAWISRTGDKGDFSREHILDGIMLDKAISHKPLSVLDVGCGEGRFCRMLKEVGISTFGVDPIAEMVEEARSRDTHGTYLQGFAEDLEFDDDTFDLVVTYLSLIDIDDAGRAIAEMVRVLKPGGRILVANLTSFSTSSIPLGRKICKETGEEFRPLGLYLQERKDWFEWDELRIQNWHRPLSQYMKWFLGQGLTLTYFDEPQPTGGPKIRVERYQEMPYLMVMEWQKTL